MLFKLPVAATILSVVCALNEGPRPAHHAHHDGRRDHHVVKNEACSTENGDMFVVHDVPYNLAEKACHHRGGALADITSANFLDASHAAFKCSGANSMTWVNSWNGDYHNGACLVMSTGSTFGAGAINTPSDCSHLRHALCVRHTHCKDRTRPCSAHKPSCHHCREAHFHKPSPCGCSCNCQDIVFRYAGDQLPAIGPLGMFNYAFSLSDFTTDDGILSIVDNQLVVNSYPFTLSEPISVDRLKYVIYTNQFFTVPPTGELSYSAKIKSAAFGVDLQPFGSQVQDPQSDFRLANTALIINDYWSGLAFEFFITNTRIYAVYERLDYDRPPLGPYAAFTFAMPVGNTLPNQTHTYSINLNGAEKSVRWLVDGVEVYKIYTTGSRISRTLMSLDLGGVEQHIFPHNVTVGFGTLTLLDGYSPCNVQIPVPGPALQCQFPANETGLVQLSPPGAHFNPRYGDPVPALYVDNGENPAYRLFGQGIIMAISNVTIGYCKSLECHGRSTEFPPLPQFG